MRGRIKYPTDQATMIKDPAMTRYFGPTSSMAKKIAKHCDVPENVCLTIQNVYHKSQILWCTNCFTSVHIYLCNKTMWRNCKCMVWQFTINVKWKMRFTHQRGNISNSYTNFLFAYVFLHLMCIVNCHTRYIIFIYEFYMVI